MCVCYCLHKLCHACISLAMMNVAIGIPMVLFWKQKLTITRAEAKAASSTPLTCINDRYDDENKNLKKPSLFIDMSNWRRPTEGDTDTFNTNTFER